MGRARLYKRLRKQANYKWESTITRQWLKSVKGTMQSVGVRAAYRALKVLVRKSHVAKDPIVGHSQTARRRFFRENPCYLDALFTPQQRTRYEY